MVRLLRVVALVGALFQAATAIEMDLNNRDSVRNAASTIAFGLMKYYTGNNTGDVPGNLPDPYFWWEAGAMFGTLVDYWQITGDSTYNAVTLQAMVHQIGEDRDLLPRNQSSTEGNDDQGFWAMALMSAAETNFPNPPSDQPQWLATAQGVFNQYVSRWDEAECGGGLRWQIFQLNGGYNYKNSISNGCFFNLASRLARYTGNNTYAEWAAKVWDWQVDVGLIMDDYRVEDGAHVENQCTQNTKSLWSYNAGIFLHGAAVMYNITEDDTWKTRLDGIIKKTTSLFFKNSIAVEQNCEPFKVCNIDQRSFKGYLLRWMAASARIAPHTVDTIVPLLRATGDAAAASCDGTPAPDKFMGTAGTACGQDWSKRTFDGFTGVGEQMNALSAVIYTQLSDLSAPLTADDGGTSPGDVNAGTGSKKGEYAWGPIETKDRVGAAFLTIAICIGVVGGTAFVMV